MEIAIRNAIIYQKTKNSYLSHFIMDIFPKAYANKTGNNFLFFYYDTYGKLSVIRQYTWFILIFMKNCLQYDAIPDFSVSLRTGSHPAYINWFQSHTGKLLP